MAVSSCSCPLRLERGLSLASDGGAGSAGAGVCCVCGEAHYWSLLTQSWRGQNWGCHWREWVSIFCASLRVAGRGHAVCVAARRSAPPAAGLPRAGRAWGSQFVEEWKCSD